MEIIHFSTDGFTEIAERLFLNVHDVKTHRKKHHQKSGFTFKKAAERIQLTDAKFVVISTDF